MDKEEFGWWLAFFKVRAEREQKRTKSRQPKQPKANQTQVDN